MATMRRWRQRAEEFHTAYLVRGVFGRWRRVSEARVREKEARAEEFYQRTVLARALQGWRQVCGGEGGGVGAGVWGGRGRVEAGVLLCSLLRFIVGASLSDTIGCSDILQAYNLCKL